MSLYRMDMTDIQILRILADNCRLSFRSIGEKLGITTNTVKRRVNNLVNNNVISKFMANVSPVYLGYSVVILLTIRLNKETHKKLEKKLADFGQVYFHVQGAGGLAVFGLATKKQNSQYTEVKQRRPPIVQKIEEAIKPAQVYNAFCSSKLSTSIVLKDIDLQMIKYLVSKPRATALSVASDLAVSQKTVIRRLERMRKYKVLEFGIVYNPEAMKGFIYFGMLIQVGHLYHKGIVQQLYTDLEDHFLRHAQLIHGDMIVLNLFAENIFQIEEMLQQVESYKGVIKAEIFLSLRIQWNHEWIAGKIDSLYSVT
jgi:DNA-binding Lrp family transcriptional regulator